MRSLAAVAILSFIMLVPVFAQNAPPEVVISLEDGRYLEGDATRIAEAWYALGVAYFEGKEPYVSQDDAEAIRWFRRAAERDHAGARYYLGLAHASGRGVAQDFGEALEWYRLSAEQDYPAAQLNLGIMHFNGEGTGSDFEAAFSWFARAAAQGYGPAYYYVGNSHMLGLGVPEDRAKGVHWYRLAAREGEPRAFAALADAYVKGHGVSPDLPTAYLWQSAAERHGWGSHAGVLEALAARLTPEEVKAANDASLVCEASGWRVC